MPAKAQLLLQLFLDFSLVMGQAPFLLLNQVSSGLAKIPFYAVHTTAAACPWGTRLERTHWWLAGIALTKFVIRTSPLGRQDWGVGLGPVGCHDAMQQHRQEQSYQLPLSCSVVWQERLNALFLSSSSSHNLQNLQASGLLDDLIINFTILQV